MALKIKRDSDGLVPVLKDRGYVLTKDYLLKMIGIHERMQCGVPVIISGETGVGKTAIISEAARRLGVPLIRLNLSSSTSIMSLYGSSFPTKNGEKMQVEFKEGPFTLAFKLGAWLLLDEFNLAPDNVLSSIESALDTSVLILPIDSVESSEQTVDKKYLEIPMHSNFRLFCTQNPSTGLFKGKRENL